MSCTLGVSPLWTVAAQNISTRLKGGKYPPFCGALHWSATGLLPADFSRVAVFGPLYHASVVGPRTKLALRRKGLRLLEGGKFHLYAVECIGNAGSLPALPLPPGHPAARLGCPVPVPWLGMPPLLCTMPACCWCSMPPGRFFIYRRLLVLPGIGLSWALPMCPVCIALCPCCRWHGEEDLRWRPVCPGGFVAHVGCLERCCSFPHQRFLLP